MTADVHNLVTLKNIGAAKGLLQSLVPRAQCFCFYDTTRSCIWSSDGVDDYEIDNFVADLPGDIVMGSDRDADILRRTLTSGRTLLVLPVHVGDGDGLGILVSVFSKNAGKSSWFNPNLLKNILLPAVQVIGETLRLNHELERSRKDRDGVDKELQLVYQIDKKIHGTSRSHASLAQLVGQSGRFLGIAYSVLLMPSKRIRISATHSSWKDVNRKSVDKYLLDKLLVELEGHRSPVVFEMPEVPGSDSPADKETQALLCPLIDNAGNVEGVLAQLGRVNGREFGKRHIRFMSHIVRKVEYVIEQSFDSMTGLMNRAGFEAQLRESMKSLKGEDDLHFLIYFDLDNLQLVNDTFGRQAGDEVIMRFAQLIGEHLPQNAVATRLTGDDFVILQAHGTVDDALELTSKIRNDSQVLRYLQGDKSLQVTISAGISSLDKRHGEAEALTAARIACDAAKDHGRDGVEVYDQDNQSIIRRYDDMYLVSEIQNSLDADDFRLMAQPIVALNAEDEGQRYEILLRMKDKQGNRVSSSAFFSAAERYQLMPQIDRWVVSHTLAGLAPHAEFLEITGSIFSINLSGQSLGDPDLLQFIEDEIDNSGVPPQCLCFEVTESAAVSSRNKAQAFIDALRKRGCSFSLDDFGAGLSSFAYLKNFAVDTLKIDGGFVRDITSNRISESMVAAITQVAKVMELQTVAEYVETAEAKVLLKKLGVDYVQGHEVGKPAAFDKVLEEIVVRSAASYA
jgi:diguanylate cyclase (GGDEF)-like protein